MIAIRPSAGRSRPSRAATSSQSSPIAASSSSRSIRASAASPKTTPSAAERRPLGAACREPDPLDVGRERRHREQHRETGLQAVDSEHREVRARRPDRERDQRGDRSHPPPHQPKDQQAGEHGDGREQERGRMDRRDQVAAGGRQDREQQDQIEGMEAVAGRHPVEGHAAAADDVLGELQVVEGVVLVDVEADQRSVVRQRHGQPHRKRRPSRASRQAKIQGALLRMRARRGQAASLPRPRARKPERVYFWRRRPRSARPPRPRPSSAARGGLGDDRRGAVEGVRVLVACHREVHVDAHEVVGPGPRRPGDRPQVDGGLRVGRGWLPRTTGGCPALRSGSSRHRPARACRRTAP